METLENLQGPRTVKETFMGPTSVFLIKETMLNPKSIRVRTPVQLNTMCA